MLSVPRQGSRHSSFRPSPCQVGVGVRRDRRESAGREPSCLPIAGDLFGPPAVAIPSPPAGCPVPGLPLPQARRSREITPPSAAHPARRLREITPPSTAHPARLSREIVAAIRGRSLPPSVAHPGPPFAGDHAAGSPLTQAPWIQSTCSGQECRVYVLLCPQEHFN